MFRREVQTAAAAPASEPLNIIFTIPPIQLLDMLLTAIVLLLWWVLSSLSEASALLVGHNRKGVPTSRSASLQSTKLSLPFGGSSDGQSRRSSASTPPPQPSSALALSALATPELPVERMVYESAALFAECLLDESDVDVTLFLKASRHFIKVLEKIGPFTMLSVRETHANLQKIEQVGRAR